MKVRFVEDIEMVPYGKDISLEDISTMNEVKVRSVHGNLTLKGLLKKNGLELDFHQLERQVEANVRIIEFSDLVYLNYQLRSDKKGRIDNCRLKEDDFILVSRFNGQYFTDEYNWVRYSVDWPYFNLPGTFRSKRLRGLEIAQVLVFVNIFSDRDAVIRSQELIMINGKSKTVFDKLDWGDHILVSGLVVPERKSNERVVVNK